MTTYGMFPNATQISHSRPISPQQSTQQPIHHSLSMTASAPSSISGSLHEQVEHELLLESGDEESFSHEEAGSKTAAEIRAEKRKMKRFSDTRRAKLKRLTVDDQASMLKSRALPDGFDPAQTLYNPYDRPSHAHPADFPMLYPSSSFGPDIRRPLTTGGLVSLNGDTDTISPTSGASSYGEGYQTPRSFSMSANLSPASPSSNSPQVFTTSTSQHTNSPAINSSIRSKSFPTLYSTPFQSLEFAAQESLLRSRAASSAHPTPASYLQGLAENDSTLPYRRESAHSHMHQHLYTRANILHYPPADTPQDAPAVTMSPDPTIEYEAWPQTSSELSRSFSIDLSYSADINNQPCYRSTKELGGGQDSKPIGLIHSAPLAMPPEFQTPQWAQPHQTSEFQLPIRHAYNANMQAISPWPPDQTVDPYRLERPQRAPLARSFNTSHGQEGISFESHTNETWPE
ncbi:MAG: hypothetical protein Q9212_002136 [Teloschistes hypoglaucus]